MKASRITMATTSVALALLVSACGGGGGGGGGGNGGDGPAAAAAIFDERSGLSVDNQVLREQTGVRQDRPKQTASMVVTTRGNTERMAGAIEFRGPDADGDNANGRVVFYGDSNGDGDFNDEFDLNASVQHGFVVNRNQADNAKNPDTGENVVEIRSEDIGGDEVIVAVNEPRFGQVNVIYVPATEDSKMYAGAFLMNTNADGTYGVFGRNTSEDEVDALRRIGGSATYAGIADMHIRRNSDQNPRAESGTYSGSATGRVNFDTNAVTSTAKVRRDRVYSNGSDAVTASMTGTLADNGRINGSVTYEGLAPRGSNATGDFKGRLFGPNGETLGGTYAGRVREDGNSNYANVGGVLLMNRTDD